jgi:hypothetical protein
MICKGKQSRIRMFPALGKSVGNSGEIVPDQRVGRVRCLFYLEDVTQMVSHGECQPFRPGFPCIGLPVTHHAEDRRGSRNSLYVSP